MAYRLTVSEAQAASIGLLVRHTPSKYPILYDPISGVNLKQMEADASIDLEDKIDVRNLLKLADQGCCTLLPLFSITSVVVDGTADIVGVGQAEAGEIVTLTLSNIEEGKKFGSLAILDSESEVVATTEVVPGLQYSFVMPASDIAITLTLVIDELPRFETFQFLQPNYSVVLSADVSGVIDSEAMTVNVHIPLSAQSSPPLVSRSFIATWTFADGREAEVYVGGSQRFSGVDVIDYTSPITMKVYEPGTYMSMISRDYTVTVTVETA